MGLSSCIKKAEQFIKKQRNEAMRKSGKPAADKLLADQTAALESLQARLGDIASLNADDSAAADAIRSAIEDLFIDRESLEIQIAGRGIEVKAAPFKLEDVVSKQGSTIPSGWTSSQDFNDRDTFEYSPAGRDSNWASVTHIGGAKEKGAFSVRIYEGRNAPVTEEIFGTRSSVLVQAKESVDAKNAQPVHIEGGEIERVTPAVVAESLKKSAANTKFNPKEALNWLTSEVKKAIASAPAVAEWKTEDHGFKTFDVLGDGTFKVKNAKENLESFIAKVEASPGFKNVRTPKPQLVADWQKTGKAGSEAEVREMLVDGDYTAALEFSKQLGKPMIFGANDQSKRSTPIPYTEVRPFEVDGYEDFKFASARSWNGKDGSDKWHVIELSTGLTMGNGSNRKAAEFAVRASLRDKTTPEKLSATIADKLKSGFGRAQDVLEKEWVEWAEKEEGGDSLLSDQKAEAAKPELQRDNEKLDAEYRKKWHSTGVGQGGVIHYKREFEFEGKNVEAVMWETAGRYDDGYVTYDGKRVFTARDTVNGAQEQIDRFLDSRYLSQDHDSASRRAEADEQSTETIIEDKSEPNPLTQSEPEESGLKKRESKPASKSADAGEELTYNKRNRRKDGIKWDEISDKNDALKAKEVVKAKVYPKPDYEALVAGGMKPVIAHMVKQMYDGIASAPKLGRGDVLSDASMKAYIDGVNRVMDAVMAWANDSQTVASWAGRQVRMAGQSFNVMDTFNKNDTPLNFVYPNGWKERQAEVRYLGGNKFYGALQPGHAEVARFLKDQKLGWPAKADLWKKQGYKILEATGLEVDSRVANRRDGSTSVFAYLSSKGDGRSNAIESLVFDGAKSVEDADVKAAIDQRLSELEGKYVVQDKVGRFVGAFDSMEEAEQGAKDATKREQDSGKVKEIGRVVTEVERVGADRRMEGQNVSAQELVDTFGFRGINFGNSMQGDSKSLINERQLHLNHIYDAFLDLAEILNLPPKAMSLNGMLGIAVGAQGSGKALAHFVPGVNEINITRRAGAGALAHEFAHAIDHYFANMAGASTKQRPYMTELVSGPKNETVRIDGQWVTRPVSTQNVRQEVADQFRAVVEAMKKRPETEEERKQRLEDGKEKAMKGIKQWMDYFRREISKVNGVDNSEYIKALDVAEGRINNMDFGDGVIAVSKNTEVHPVVADIKNAVEKATGVAPKTDHLNAISIYIDRAKAFDGVLKSTESHDPQIVDTNYLKTSKSADGKKQQGYWSSTLEMFARALDAYVVDSLKERGNKNEYLSGIEAVAPAGEERAIINKAFDFLFAELKTMETDQGTAIYNLDPFYDHYKNQAHRFNNDPERERSAIGDDGIFRDSNSGIVRRNVAGRSGRIEANGMPRWVRGSQPEVANYIGQEVKSAEDLADIAQVYRDPRYETMRYFFVKDDVIVSQNAVSSRLPGSSSVFFGKTDSERKSWIDKIANEASALGVDGVYLLHNHPNGDPTASDGDMDATIFIANEMASRGINALAHVIINHNKYGVIAPDGNGRIKRSVVLKEYNAEEQYSFDNPKVAHPVLGSSAQSPREVAKVAKQAQVSSGEVVIIGISGTSGVSLLAEVTPSQISTPKIASAIMRRLARQSGSSHLYAYGLPYASMSLMARAIRKGVIVDAIVIDENGTEWSVAGVTGAKPEEGVHFGLHAYANEVEIPAKYAKDAKRTNVSPAQIRESLINQFGDAGVRALEKTGMLKIMRLEEAPSSILEEAIEQGASALYTADGVAYLFSDRMTANEAPGKLLHEIGEHHGLESMLGSDGWGRMKKRIVAMAKAKGSVANGAWEGVKANYGEFAGMSDDQLAGNDRFLHEVLASIGENKAGLKTSLWRELVAQVKEWLASKGFLTDSITEGDIANLVSGSLKKVMRQAQSGLVGQATMTDIAYDYFKDIVSAMKYSQLLIEDCA